MKKQSGFSLIEVLIVMTVFMIVVGSIYGLLQVGFVDRNRTSREADILKNARIAIHLIGRDALNAGLGYTKFGAVVPDDFLAARLGLPVDTNTNRDLLTSVVAGNNLFISRPHPNPNARADTIAFAYRDIDFNCGGTVSINDAITSGQSLILVVNPTQVSPCQGNTNPLQHARVYDLYLVETGSTQVAVIASGIDINNRRITITPNDPLGLNQPANGTGQNANLLRKCLSGSDTNCTTYPGVVLKRFFWVAYRVREDGTLVRITFGNNPDGGPTGQIQEMPIAYNVEDLQITYLLEDNRVMDNPMAGPNGIYGDGDDTPQAMNDVVKVTVSITVQAPEVDEQLRGSSGERLPRRFTLTSSFSTRNIIYDAG